MKHALVTMIMIASSIAPISAQQVASPAKPADAQQLYRQGLSAIEQGDASEGEQYLRASLKLQPDNPNAKYQLTQLMLNRNAIVAKKRELTLNKIIIPAVEYSDASLSECLESLSAIIDKQTDKKFTPNFIVRDPDGEFKNARVTLKLNNLPATAILKYILASTNGRAIYEEHAVVIAPAMKTK
jgi:hypothetical protein